MNVLEAARERMSWVFDRFARVVVSVSGGKDSTVLHHLAMEEAERRGRKVEVFFLDQEAEYAATIEQVERMMRHPAAVPVWLQVPLRMTNATSHRAIWLNAWEPGAEWMRPRHELGIADIEGAPDRFYDIFPWWERQSAEPTAFLVGIRSRESLNRWRAVQKNPGMEGIGWSTKTERADSFRFYPLYDWNTGDVWKYLADTGIPYNRVYDQMIALRGANQRTARVSCLIHEQAYKALALLQEIEPETYDRLVRRLGGVHCAALYAEDTKVFKADALPEAFSGWRAYRDYLMETTPLAEGKMARFTKRFAGQGDDEATCREHVRQLLINDWENNVPVRRQSAERLRAAWWGRL
jgi:predicted phosphoadenosine phosphosulfate sulfurtransferase